VAVVELLLAKPVPDLSLLKTLVEPIEELVLWDDFLPS